MRRGFPAIGGNYNPEPEVSSAGVLFGLFFYIIIYFKIQFDFGLRSVPYFGTLPILLVDTIIVNFSIRCFGKKWEIEKIRWRGSSTGDFDCHHSRSSSGEHYGFYGRGNPDAGEECVTPPADRPPVCNPYVCPKSGWGHCSQTGSSPGVELPGIPDHDSRFTGES